jgi:hypothetical protein
VLRFLFTRQFYELVFCEACRSGSDMDKHVKDWKKLVVSLIDGCIHIRNKIMEHHGNIPEQFVDDFASVHFFAVQAKGI